MFPLFSLHSKIRMIVWHSMCSVHHGNSIQCASTVLEMQLIVMFEFDGEQPWHLHYLRKFHEAVRQQLCTRITENKREVLLVKPNFKFQNAFSVHFSISFLKIIFCYSCVLIIFMFKCFLLCTFLFYSSVRQSHCKNIMNNPYIVYVC